MHTIILNKGDLINIQNGIMIKPGAMFPEEMHGFYEILGYLKTPYKERKNSYTTQHPYENALVLKSVIDSEGFYNYCIGQPFLRTICTDRIRIDLEINLIGYGFSVENLLKCVGDYEIK